MNTCIRVYANSIQTNQCREDLGVKEQVFLDLAEVLDMAGIPVRLIILYLFQKEGQLCPCDMSDILDMILPATSQHLKKLKEVRIVTSKKFGQTPSYSLEIKSQRVIISLLDLLGQS